MPITVFIINDNLNSTLFIYFQPSCRRLLITDSAAPMRAVAASK